MENKFKTSLLDPNVFSVTWEVVPGRGAREKAQLDALKAAEAAANDPRVHAITITDSPGGNPAIMADELGREIHKLGIEPLVHFTCKDKNRNQMESQLYALDHANLYNLLVMTGDYQDGGFKGRSKPVFDIDPVHTFQLIEEMNAGLVVPIGPTKTAQNQPSEFLAGCAVSPFKQTEAEQMVQYFKLKKKVEGGAKFVITQLGYDVRKIHEVLQFMRLNNLNVPLIGNIYILPYGAARVMNNNQLAGCVVPDKLLKELEQEKQAEDKGKHARLVRAARMYGIMKGLGFSGVHIGGHNISYADLDYVLNEGENCAKNWQLYLPLFDYPMQDGFYYYEKDTKTGLNTETPSDLKNTLPADKIQFIYKLSRVVHKLMFVPRKNLFGFMTWASKKADGTWRERPYHWVEHMAKVVFYDCKDCGDCALPNLAYNCPMSKCPKHQRNGACGGSRDGWCEVYPGERKCIYVKAYTRLKHYGGEQELNDYITPPADWHFYQHSSWINFYLGRDHDGPRLNIPYVPKKENKKTKDLKYKN